MLKWTKTGRTVSPEGTTITYAAEGTGLTIESRKRHIPHANRSGYCRSGYWDHTTYYILKDGEEVIERWSLEGAKEYAEIIWEDIHE